MAGRRQNRGRQPTRARIALAFALAVSACGEAAQPEAGAAAKRLAASWSAPTPLLVGNWLRNPGFEAGTASWEGLGRAQSAGFEIASEPVRSGGAAAFLLAIWEPGAHERPVSFRTASQEISPPRFPDRVAGWYRVERWEDAPEPGVLQLQVIVSAIGDPRSREIIASQYPDVGDLPAALNSLQVRYQLAGVAEALEGGGNVKQIAVGTGAPPLATWVRFEQRVKDDFARLWGTVPRDFDQLRVMFGVRWDDKPDGAALRADVYYDDLFFGFDDLPSRRGDPPQR